jgi:hypothetical protein
LIAFNLSIEVFYLVAANGLQLPDGFYFGLSWHCLIVKNIAIKLEKFFTEIHIAIFSLQKFQSNFKLNKPTVRPK